MIPYGLLYRLGLAPWERRDIADSWQPLLDSAQAPALGRALDVGCGSGRDAVYLAKRGWQVTGVDAVEKPLASARRRAAEEGVEVQWVRGDVAELGRLGLQAGYRLLYDFGCIHGLSDADRKGAAAGLTQLAAPRATLLITAFRAGRGFALPRGMNQEDVIALLGDGWTLEQTRSAVADDMPPVLRRAHPTVYRLIRRAPAESPSADTGTTTGDPAST
jgi:SAM-dependent methyltransferase